MATTRLDRIADAPYESAVWMGRTYFRETFTDEPADMHNDMAEVLRGPAKLVGITGPSGGAKSAVVRSWLSDEAVFGLRMFHAAVVGPIDKVAIAQLGALRSLLESADLLKRDVGDVRSGNWKAYELEVYKAVDMPLPPEKRRTCLIRVAFPGTPIRSLVHTTQGRTYRLQVASIDDAERKQDVGSDAVLRAFRAYLYDELLPRLDWAGGYAKLVWSGNMSEHSALASMFEGQPYRDPTTGEPYGDSEPSRVELYKRWTLCRYDCYLPDGTTYWGRWTHALLDEQRESLAVHPGAFDRQYRQIARSSDDAGLPLEVFADKRCYPHDAPAGIEAARELWPGLQTYMSFDDAKTTGKASDYSAISVVGVTAEGDMVVLYLEQRKVVIGQQTEWALGIHQNWQPTVLVGEDPRLLEDIKTKGRKHAPPIYVNVHKAVHGRTPKRVRMLETLRPALINGHLRFPRNRQDWRQVVRDGCYPGADHDDGADSLQMAVARAMAKGSALATGAMVEDDMGGDGVDYRSSEWVMNDEV